jgi:hypothetical protein
MDHGKDRSLPVRPPGSGVGLNWLLPPGFGKTHFLGKLFTDVTHWQQYRSEVREQISINRGRLKTLINADTPINKIVAPCTVVSHAGQSVYVEYLQTISRVVSNLKHLTAILSLARSVLSRFASLSRNPILASHKAVAERKFFVLHEAHPPDVAVDFDGLFLGVFQTY